MAIKFLGFDSLDSRLRGSEGAVWFVIPAEAGGKRPKGDSEPVFVQQQSSKILKNLKIIKNHIIVNILIPDKEKFHDF
jgi:hypothetical protein